MLDLEQQAAARRAAADAQARAGGATGSRSPQRTGPLAGLRRIPGARWVFGTILLGASAALAIDYLNTPIKAWLQYHAFVPGGGGKSVARIAAEESAAEQAKIDVEVTQPAIADARQKAVDDGEAEEEFRKTHVGPTMYSADPSMGVVDVDGQLGQLLVYNLPLPPFSQIDDTMGGNDFVFSRPKPMDSPIIPFVLNDHKTLAIIHQPAAAALDAPHGGPRPANPDQDWVIFARPDKTYGAMLLTDFKRLKVAGPTPADVHDFMNRNAAN